MTDPLQPDIDRAARRAAHYWVHDGLNEMIVGALFLVIGAYLALDAAVPADHPLEPWINTGFPLLVVGLALGVPRLVLALKDRYVHPHTGYVQMQRRGSSARIAAGLLGGAIAALTALLVRSSGLLAWLPAAQGILLGVLFFFAGRKVNLARFPIEGLFCVAAGFALSRLRLDEDLASGILFAWTGVVLAVGGALAFRAYLRQVASREDA